ncbi:hypothetical protein EV175_003565 [Coemansia sp. RSA 1933]|nr:hypothetical protein EV175_003565 [Coemansia sp. RSA 1933]
MSTAEPAKLTAQVPPRPTRTISDEFRELQYIVNRFQEQLNSPDGIVGLHPYGPVNVDQARQSFAQACKRLRDALVSYRDTTLGSWSRLFATDGNNPNLMTITNRTTAAAQELVQMRQITDSLHEDADKCCAFLLDAAADAISRSLTDQHHPTENAVGQTIVLIERLKATAKRLGLAYYTDVQKVDGQGEVTTVTLAGGILVIDVDIGSTMKQLKVKVSYVSDIEHDERINTLMLRRLEAGDIRGFEKLVQEMATLDRLTNERSPANFIHNTFAVISTLAEIQRQEISALDGDSSQLLRYGTGIALPHARHVGPSTLYYIPAIAKAGLTASDWRDLEENSLDGIADVSGCSWLYYAWEPTNVPHCFLSALFSQHCLSSDYTLEDSESHKVVTVKHPTIHGLDMRFLEFVRKEGGNSSVEAMQVDGQESAANINDEFWIPYTLVARVEPPLPACALTIRGIMAATVASTDDSISVSPSSDPNTKPLSGIQDSPRLLEDAPTLESLLFSSNTLKSDVSSTIHTAYQTPILMSLEQPQIRAWTIERVPLNDLRSVLLLVPLLRRQAKFNELLASCIGDAIENNDATCSSATTPAAVSAQTHANDPFRIDIVARSTGDKASTSSPSRMDVDQQNDQSAIDSNIESGGAKGSNGVVLGMILRVVESTGDTTAWLHRDLGITLPKKSPLSALGEIPSSSLSPNTSHKNITKAVRISNSVPLVVSWMLEHSSKL